MPALCLTRLNRKLKEKTVLTHERCLEALEILRDLDLPALAVFLELLLMPHPNREHPQTQTQA